MNSRPSDFRSDTVTLPTDSMRRAMATAELGDDVYGEDPTVRRLEERTAEVLGMPAALFVPTGSMGNQIALRVSARSGSEVILEARSHIFHFEMAAMASLSGLLPRPIATARGVVEASQVEPWIRPESVYYLPRTSLIALENTHNLAGGTVTRRESTDEIQVLARARGIPVHLDGARLWNAAAALGVQEAELARGFQSVMVCFSKGLRAPVGSALAGSVELIAEARRVRKLFGGGMRQAGVIAAAALVALEEERPRLGEDHRRARMLADGLAELESVTIDPTLVETNIVVFEVAAEGSLDAASVVKRLSASGVLASALGPKTVRLVTHAGVDDSDVEKALAAFRELGRGGA